MDPEGIVKVLNVLIENAVKYSPRGSVVEISAVSGDKQASIEVVDRGIGIKPSETKHIFDRFYRADSARSKSEAGGYGLGLSIAKSIVDLHDGSLKVASTPGERTVFSVTLPKT